MQSFVRTKAKTVWKDDLVFIHSMTYDGSYFSIQTLFFSFNRGRVQGARGFGLDFLVYITLSMSHNNMNHSLYPKTKS